MFSALALTHVWCLRFCSVLATFYPPRQKD
jgi:hypothetical protein